MLADDAAILAQLDAIGVGPDLDWPANGTRRDRVFVVAKRTRQVLETVAGTAWKPSNGPA
jgi:hypothetical protein